MCGAGVEQHYLDLAKEQEQDNDIEKVLFSNSSFAAIFFSTFTISVPSKD